MYVVDQREKGLYSLPAKIVKPEDAKDVGSELAIKVMTLLAKEPMYPIQIAKALKVNEQKIYYHIHQLVKSGFVVQVKQETKQGAQAKYFSLDKPAFVIAFKELDNTQKLLRTPDESKVLEPFIQDGKFNALFVVGSPDPHGPEKARSRDGYYGMDLALFLGTFLHYTPKPNVILDTEVRDEQIRENNLIIIGGPVVNRVTEMVNAKLPIRFEKEMHWALKSSLSGQVYPNDEIGLIVKAKNPFNPEKWILLIAGKRYQGTRAAIIGFTLHFSEIAKGNFFSKDKLAKVVEGVDYDSDGTVDDVEIRE